MHGTVVTVLTLRSYLKHCESTSDATMRVRNRLYRSHVFILARSFACHTLIVSTVFQRLLGPRGIRSDKGHLESRPCLVVFPPPPYRVAPVKESGLVHSQRALSPSST